MKDEKNFTKVMEKIEKESIWALNDEEMKTYIEGDNDAQEWLKPQIDKDFVI